MKIVLFEGIDKVGKTTTIEKLKKELSSFGFKVLKLNLPYTIDYEDIDNKNSTFRLKMSIKNLMTMYDEYDENYICLIDRLHISEKVYGKLLRDKFDRTTFYYSDYYLSEMRVKLIYLVPNDVHGNYEKFKDEKGLIDGLTEEQYIDTYEMFNETIVKTKIKDILTLKTCEIDTKRIIEFLGGKL